jgi:hypothetical protein
LGAPIAKKNVEDIWVLYKTRKLILYGPMTILKTGDGKKYGRSID